MKTQKVSLIISVLGLIVLCLVTVSPAHAYSILVYGRKGCGFTQIMRQNLDKNKYHYTYYDVDKNKAKSSEMWGKIHRGCPSCSSTRLPVLDLNGKILIRPSFEEVKKKIGPP
jgi:glutaredoxin